MKHIKQEALNMSNTCIAFGSFDGVHIGHRSVVDKVVELSKAGEMTSVVVTYEYNEELLENRKILSTQLEKEKLLSQNDVDIMVSYEINKSNKDVAAVDFIKEVLVDSLGAKIIVAGQEDKNIEELRKCSKEYGFKLVECATVCMDNEPVTSERIIQEISQGNMSTANEMLGHAYLIIGEVMHGKALGRTVGMPTANIGYALYKQLPKFGVYGTLSNIDGRDVKGLTNIGKRPSVDNFDYATIEAFLLDFSGDLYGKVITLEVHVYIRGVVKFNSLDEVKAQVNKDIESIRTYLDQL